jgi:hypothetical protein
VDVTILAQKPILLAYSNCDILLGGYCSSGRLFFVYPLTPNPPHTPSGGQLHKKQNKNKSNIVYPSIYWRLFPLIFLSSLFWPMVGEEDTGREGKVTGAFFCGSLQS